MRNTAIFIGMLFLIYSCSVLYDGFQIKKSERSVPSKYAFMSRTHSGIYMGVAALIIMMQHVGGCFGTNVFTPLGGTGVAMFLIASGYGLNESNKKRQIEDHSHSAKNRGGYWKYRLLRVFIPYTLFETLLIPYYGDFDVTDYLLDITCLDPRYWYFGILLVGYFAFWLCILNDQMYKYRYWILGAFAIAVFFIRDAIYAEQALSFMVGVFISDKYERIKQWADKNLTLAITAVLGIALLAVKQIPLVRAYEDTYLWYLIQMCMKLSMAVFLIVLTYWLPRLFRNSFLTWCGALSMELYLVHYQMLYIYGLQLPVIVKIILFVGGTMVGAWILNFGIKKLTEAENRFFKCD